MMDAASVRDEAVISTATPCETETARMQPRSGARSKARIRLLMLSSLVALPYRVMRVARGAGAEVYVLGGPAANGLRLSRSCTRFLACRRPIAGERDGALAHEINRAIAAFGIAMVIPGDAQAARSLLASRDLLDAPCFPSPDLKQFDYLNNKWHFTTLCRSLGVCCPKSWLVRDASELKAKLADGEIPLPAMAKPLNYDGGLGVIKLEPQALGEKLAAIDYAPLIVQEFIAGDDIGASIYCVAGEIRAFVAHRLTPAVYHAFDDPGIFAVLQRLMRRVRADGVLNFDMRVTPGGRIYYLECNPRFFFKMNLSMLAGINFVALALPGSMRSGLVRAQGDVRMPRALAAAALRTPRRLTRRDFAMLWHVWGDPLFRLREKLGIDRKHPNDAIKARHFPKAEVETAGSESWPELVCPNV